MHFILPVEIHLVNVALWATEELFGLEKHFFICFFFLDFKSLYKNSEKRKKMKKGDIFVIKNKMKI